ncbi:MAG TPA: RDD family protein [Streptosporangiaceae bacterium]|nr:RDD family protein [Streptosporangiaceae bacterium]
MTQPPQDPGEAPYDGAYKEPPPGQDPYGPAGPAGQQPHGVPYRPYTQPAPVPPYTEQPPPPFGQPAQPGYGQPPYGQLAQQPYGSPYQAYPAPAGGYQPSAYQGRDPSLAEWWQRLLARFIDGIVLFALTAVAWIPAGLAEIHRLRQITVQFPDSSTPAAQAAISQAGTVLLRDILLLLVLTVAISFCYDWLQHARWGQTLGKRALGTMVVTADGRSKISGGTAAGRAVVSVLAPAVPLAGGIFGLLDDLWLLWDPRRQCLHDKALSTVVVKTSVPPPTAAPQQRPW